MSTKLKRHVDQEWPDIGPSGHFLAPNSPSISFVFSNFVTDNNFYLYSVIQWKIIFMEFLLQRISSIFSYYLVKFCLYINTIISIYFNIVCNTDLRENNWGLNPHTFSSMYFVESKFHSLITGAHLADMLR